MRFLLCTDGTYVAENAISLGLLLARASGADVTLLGLAASPEDEARVRASMAQAQGRLPRRAEERFRLGRAAREILAEASAEDYTLIVVGSRGRRGWVRLAFGSVAARLARYSPSPVLIVKGAPRPGVRRVLACTAGDYRGERVARWGGRVAHWVKAELTVLHVMSQMGISPEAKFDELMATAEEAIAHGTREGRHLAREIELAMEEDGAPMPAPRAKLRHGLVVDEVVAEAEEHDYDLVVIGGHQGPEAAEEWGRLRAYLLEDVADKIIMALTRPVLVVKGS